MQAGPLSDIYPVNVGLMAEAEILVPAEWKDRANGVLADYGSSAVHDEADPEQERQGISLLIDDMRDEIIGFLQELIRTESINPPGHTRRVIRVIADKLDSFGAEYETVSVDESRQSIVAWLNRNTHPCIILNSHIDTVPEGDLSKWTYSPFSGELRDGRIHGRGAADAKGSVCAMIMAVKALAVSGLEFQGSVVVNPVCDEETGGEKGTAHLLSSGFYAPDYAVIGEITDNQAAIAEKGVIFLHLRTEGKSAHASTPWDGVNAIEGMMEILAAVKNHFHTHMSPHRHPLTPPPSINFGTIRGGIKTNMVAESCEATVDIRPIPGMDTQAVVKGLEAVLTTQAELHPHLLIHGEFQVLGVPFETDPEEDLVHVIRQVLRWRSLPDEPVGYAQVSDGRFFAERGIPTVILGPGNPALAHTHDEYVEVDDVVEAAKIYALTILEILRYRTGYQKKGI
jgi:succinyl-diaminopimelate desuccinylase